MSADTSVIEGLDAERQNLYVALYNERFGPAELYREAAHQPLWADDDRHLVLVRTQVLSEATDEET